VAEKTCSLSATIGVDLFLLGQFDAGTVDQSYKRQILCFGDVGHTEIIIRLARDPCAGYPLVVEADKHAPLAADPCNAVHNTGTPRFFMLRIIYGVKRKEHSRIHEIFDPFPDSQLPALMN